MKEEVRVHAKSLGRHLMAFDESSCDRCHDQGCGDADVRPSIACRGLDVLSGAVPEQADTDLDLEEI